MRILLIAIISGVITTGLFFLMIKDKDASLAEEVKQIEVVVASSDIKRNTKLTDENTAVKLIDEDEIHAEAVKDQMEVIGKFATTDIMAEEVIMNHRIQSQEEESVVVSRKITKNNRGVSIDVNYDASVSNLTIPEDYVDLILTIIPDGNSSEEIESALLLEKVRVLAVGEKMIEEDDETGEEDIYFTVTLELSQEDAIKLVQASHEGEIHLALYSKLDVIKENEESTEKED